MYTNVHLCTNELELERIKLPTHCTGGYMVFVIDGYGIYKIIGELVDVLGHEIKEIKTGYTSLIRAKSEERMLSDMYPQCTFITLSV